MKTRIYQLLMLVTAILVLAGCAVNTPAPTSTSPAATVLPTLEATATAAPLVFTDGLQRTVEFSSTPQHIVSLAPSATEILYAVGAAAQMVGRDSFSNYPEEAKTLADVGGSMGSYSYEAIANLQPDLVVATEINTPEQVKALEDLGLKVYYIANPVALDDLYPILQTMGEITGHSDDAAMLIDSLKARVEAVTAKTAAAATTPVVFYELDGTDPAKPWTAGPGTFIDQLIALAGGKNAASELSGAWAQISVEELLVQNPQVILLGDAAYGMTAEQVAARTGWGSLQAVSGGQVYPFNDDLVSRPGPRLVDALEELSKLLHPELYQ